MKRWIAPVALSMLVLLVGVLWLNGQTATVPMPYQPGGPPNPPVRDAVPPYPPVPPNPVPPPPQVSGSVQVNGSVSVSGAIDAWKEKEKRTIHVSGSGTVRVKPDAARLFFSVQTDGKTVKEAREENQKKFTKVNTALAAFKITDLKMKTTDINLAPQYARPGDEYSNAPPVVHPPGLYPTDSKRGIPKPIGYRATNGFTVLLTNGKVEELNENATRVLETALENGVNEVSQIAFLKLEETPFHREAMTKAVEDALANAKAIAAGANVTILETTTITSSDDSYSRPRRMHQLMQSSEPDGREASQVVAGELEITFSVNVTCVY